MYEDLALDLKQNLKGRLSHNHAMARHTSWHIGGQADLVYQPYDVKDLQLFYQLMYAHDPHHATYWLGLGSNLLLPDHGMREVMIMPKYGLKKMAYEGSYIRAEAGVSCAKLAKLSEQLGMYHGAFFAGIPGTVGGALAMNAGAFGYETWPYVISVEVLSPDGSITHHPASSFSWGYRHVVGLPKRSWFVSATFCFPKEKDREDVMDIKALLAKRQETQPIGSKNCGSVFRNPKGHHAAHLIDTLGLKGLREGDMIVSEKHANFIINLGHGTSEQTCILIQRLQEKVEAAFGVLLEPEVKIVKGG